LQAKKICSGVLPPPWTKQRSVYERYL
jgi:hypothetical protein